MIHLGKSLVHTQGFHKKNYLKNLVLVFKRYVNFLVEKKVEGALDFREAPLMSCFSAGEDPGIPSLKEEALLGIMTNWLN